MIGRRRRSHLVSSHFRSPQLQVKRVAFFGYSAPANLLLRIIEEAVRPVSLSLRLFGNMYAGELVFMLIALMGGAAALSLSGVLLPVGHVIAGTIWTLFHMLVITL